MSYYLGLDIGTSGTKALLMAEDGRIAATATAEHPISAPRPLWSEQNPDDWYASAITAGRKVIERSGVKPGEVAGISFSGQMHGLVITDDAGRPLRPAIIWNDQRTAEQAAMIERTVGGRDKLIELVGNAAMTSFTLTKLLWVREHEPEVYRRIKHLLLPKDYVRFRLTGEYFGDASDMSGTLMLNQRTRDWSKDIIDAFELDAGILPGVIESQAAAGKLTVQAAEALGLLPGATVIAGGGDQSVGAIGNGVCRAGLTSATIGTSGVVFVHSQKYRVDPRSRINTFCASVAGEYCMFGCILSAGGCLQWFRNMLGSEFIVKGKQAGCDPYELMTTLAGESVIGSGGVFFLPYLTGERTPHADALARGGWIGLTARTTQGDMIRAILEGVTFAMNDAVELLRKSGAAVTEVRLSGGGAKSELWRQMQADVYGAECCVMNSDEGPAFGAAILAAVGTGAYRSVPEACEKLATVRKRYLPAPGSVERYRVLHGEYQKLYPALRGVFHAVG